MSGSGSWLIPPMGFAHWFPVPWLLLLVVHLLAKLWWRSQRLLCMCRTLGVWGGSVSGSCGDVFHSSNDSTGHPLLRQVVGIWRTLLLQLGSMVRHDPRSSGFVYRICRAQRLLGVRSHWSGVSGVEISRYSTRQPISVDGDCSSLLLSALGVGREQNIV